MGDHADWVDRLLTRSLACHWDGVHWRRTTTSEKVKLWPADTETVELGTLLLKSAH